jgi:NitT/TauT family transport system ATP-binding protein
MTQPIAIQLDHVSKIYANGTVALQDLNLAIAPGQFISLVGASGCGKSTVLRLIAGLGSIQDGRIYRGDFLEQGKLAFVFQDASLMPWATVWENVRLPLKLAGVKPGDCHQAIADTLAMVNLHGFERVYPRQLSGGMQMRVSIARALVTQPDVLLMDEPFGALDEITRSKLNTDLLNLWQQQQWTVVFVTHNIYEAVYLSQRVVVMAANPGRVVADVVVDAPYPRTDTFRTSSLYNDYCREVSDHLSKVAFSL